MGDHGGTILPMVLIVVSTAFFLTIERIFPGRELPNSKGWYARALGINAFQFASVFIAGATWDVWLRNVHLFAMRDSFPPVLQGLAGYLVGTFVFYWWHRLRHKNNAFWLVFHQVHHSPTRIETITSFYKHPVEILTDSLLSALIMFGLLGSSVEGAVWFNFFAATAEYFYHSNVRTPHWLSYIIQTPQLHSIHHQLGVHGFNYSDLPIWDRLFGTLKDTDEFADRCGFPNQNERKLGSMLAFRDVYES
jgi:sterol desaturase/sphingolipid hydroxylase (fatty acid hydroxylase superfamily)